MIISCQSICKTYCSFVKEEGLKGSLKGLFHRQAQYREALKSFTFDMEKGEYVGLMGPNGAGKSTLIKVLTGIIQPSAGSLRVLDEVPFEGTNNFKRRIAVVMGQKSQLWWDLPPADTLLLQKNIYRIEDARYRANVAELCELFGVQALLNVPVRTLSLGERMKFELICALLHDPELLFLDEPTIGLDAPSQLQIRKLLKRAGKERGLSLLLTSHYTQDLLDLTPRTLVIRDGEKLYDGNLNELLHAQSQYRLVQIELTGQPELRLPDSEVIERKEGKLVLRLPNGQVKSVLADLFLQGVVGNLTVEDEDVSELINRIYAKVEDSDKES